MKKKRIEKGILLFLAFLFFIINTGMVAHGEKDNGKRTLIISTDQLDLKQIESMNIENSALSMMSAKTARDNGSSNESQFMTIATGRRVTVEEEQFTSVSKEGDGLVTDYFFNVLYRLNQDYDGFIDKFKFLGELFHDNGLKTAYLGDDSSILLAADKEGKVDYGELAVPYEYEELKNTVEDLSSKAELTVMSYNIEDNFERLNNIKKIAEEFDGTVYIIPKYISGDAVVKNNTTIKPILMKGLGSGVLESETTKRFGLVSNLDIMPTILKDYGIEYEGEVGKPLIAQEEEESIEKVMSAFTKYMNLTSVKYSFNALIVYIQIFMILLYFITGKVYKRLKFLLYIPIYSIILSLIMGSFLSSFNREIYIYTIVILAVLFSLITDFMINRMISEKRIDVEKNINIERLSILTFFMILFGIIFLPEQIYNSFVGYNNLVSGGRFFGFNNDIMGTFLGTFMMGYFLIRSRITKERRRILTIVGVALILIGLSGKFGSNFGGLATALTLSLVLIYNDFMRKISAKSKIIAVIGVIAAMILGVVFMTRGEGNHISEFADRVRLYGMEEFVYMVSRKLYQVVANAKKMPWVLALMLQLSYLFRTVYDIKGRSGVKSIIKLFLFISIVALVTNDTGVVALTYMNTFLITAHMLKIKNCK